MVSRDKQRCALVCRGPWCSDRGAKTLRDEIARQVAIGGGGTVRSYPCFGRCDRGPNLFVYPDGVWYRGVALADVPEIAAHLRGGPPVARLEEAVDRWYTRVTSASIEAALFDQPLSDQADVESTWWRRPVDWLSRKV